MCVYTAVELWCHPDVRKYFKKYVKDKGTIKTVPTDKGEKELDLLHPSYRVKRVNRRIQDMTDTDLFLDIL
jgi:repressor of nif and glnA expression